MHTCVQATLSARVVLLSKCISVFNDFIGFQFGFPYLHHCAAIIEWIADVVVSHCFAGIKTWSKLKKRQGFPANLPSWWPTSFQSANSKHWAWDSSSEQGEVLTLAHSCHLAPSPFSVFAPHIFDQISSVLRTFLLGAIASRHFRMQWYRGGSNEVFTDQASWRCGSSKSAGGEA